MLCHSKRTFCVGMSISWTMPSHAVVTIVGAALPDGVTVTGAARDTSRPAMIRAVPCGVMRNSCRSPATPLPAPNRPISRYVSSAMTYWPVPRPTVTVPSHHVRTGVPWKTETRKSSAEVVPVRGCSQTGEPRSS